MIEASKKIVLGILLAVLLALPLFPAPAASQGAGGKVYVVYDALERFGNSYPLARALAELVGHYAAVEKVLAVDEWRPGMLQDASVVVYIGLQETPLPEGLLAEIARTPKIIWFEKNIEQLAAQLRWPDFQVEGIRSDGLHVNYQQVFLLSERTDILVTQPGASAQVWAVVKDGLTAKPLAWQRGPVSYCGYLETVNRQWLVVMAKFLAQSFGEVPAAIPSAVLRIEDVSPQTEAKALKECLQEVAKYRIPFAIAVTPVSVAAGNSAVYLHERPELTALLQEAQQAGASIILHGYTHQNEFSPKTGEGYEFWNARDNLPMDNDEAFTAERIEKGVYELVRCGLLPVAFEPPHYAMSKTGYVVLAKYFNVFSGGLQLSDKNSAITMELPYQTRSPYLEGMYVVPENMGYYDGENHNEEAMLQQAAQLRSVPGVSAGFFYHAYIKPDKLASLIEGLQKQGYQFSDLRSLPIKVQTPLVQIVSMDGKLQATVADQLQESWQQDQGGVKVVVGYLGMAHILVLLLVILLFLLIIIRLKRNAWVHYEKDDT